MDLAIFKNSCAVGIFFFYPHLNLQESAIVRQDNSRLKNFLNILMFMKIAAKAIFLNFYWAEIRRMSITQFIAPNFDFLHMYMRRVGGKFTIENLHLCMETGPDGSSGAGRQVAKQRGKTMHLSGLVRP
jgi:hypothetical protein